MCFCCSTTYPDPDGKKFWLDLDNQSSDKVVVHEMLSQSHRRAAVIEIFWLYYQIRSNLILS